MIVTANVPQVSIPRPSEEGVSLYHVLRPLDLSVCCCFFFFFCWYALIDSTLVGAHGYSSHTTAYDFVAFGRGGLLKCCLKMPSQWPVATHMTIRVLSYGIPAAYSGKPPCLNPHSPCIESNCVDGAVTTYMRGRSDGWLLAGAFRARVCL